MAEVKAHRESGWGCWRRVPVGVVLVAWIGVPYLVLQRVDWRPVVMLEWDGLTRAIPFSEWSVWVYFSLYPFLAWAGLGCWRRDFPGFAWSCALTAAAGHLVFLLWPTEVPRPEVADPGPLYDWLVRADRPRNALPSLHAALSVIGGIVLWRRFVDWRGGVAVAWAAAIIGSALALRQHVVVDVVSGGLLAAGCWWVCRRCGSGPGRRDRG